MGDKAFGGADLGYSYSKDGNTGHGWHSLSASVGIGFEASPLTALNVKVVSQYNFLQVHTGTGK